MILYKYKTDSPYTEKIFTDKEVWLSNAAGLNDPFECSIQEIAANYISKKVKELKKGNIDGFLFGAINSIKNNQNFYKLTPKQTKEFLKNFGKKSFDDQYKTVKNYIYRETGRQISDPEKAFNNLDSQLNDIGIFSLTETDTNILMWAHYTNSSKGIAIGFKVENGKKLKDNNHCVQVQYSDELPKFEGEGLITSISFMANGENIQKIEFEDHNLKNAVSTKSPEWEYEKEWRYIEETSGTYPLPGKICEIVFGLNCPKETREKYIKLCKESVGNKVNFFEIKKLKNSNKLTKSEL